jgi:hypothetical protein
MRSNENPLVITIFSLIATCVLLAGPALADDCLSQYLDTKALVTLAKCQDVKCVERARSAQNPELTIPAVFSAARLADLQGAAADSAILAAIPQDSLTFHIAYAITEPELGDRVQDVRFLFWRFFDHAVAAVIRHPAEMRRFIRLQLFTDGETKAAVVDGAREVMKKRRTAYCAAVATFSRAQRELISPSCD